MEANQTVGKGFFTAPSRTVSGYLTREVSSTFADVWSQVRLFYNSLIPVEQQFLINAMRFETSHLTSAVVKSNVIIQLNRVSNDLAKRVAEVIGIDAPAPSPKYYNNNSTAFVSIFNKTLPTIATLKVGVLASVSSQDSIAQAAALLQAFSSSGVVVSVVGETLAAGINQTYSASDATGFDGIVVTTDSQALFTNGTSSTFFPADRPLQILEDAYRWGKPVGALGSSASVLELAGATTTAGVFSDAAGNVASLVKDFEGGLAEFKFIDRFPLDK